MNEPKLETAHIKEIVHETLQAQAAESREWRRDVNNAIEKLVESQTTLNISMARNQEQFKRFEDMFMERVKALEAFRETVTAQFVAIQHRVADCEHEEKVYQSQVNSKIEALENKIEGNAKEHQTLKEKIDSILMRYIYPVGVIGLLAKDNIPFLS